LKLPDKRRWNFLRQLLDALEARHHNELALRFEDMFAGFVGVCEFAPVNSSVLHCRAFDANAAGGVACVVKDSWKSLEANLLAILVPKNINFLSARHAANEASVSVLDDREGLGQLHGELELFTLRPERERANLAFFLLDRIAPLV
jgi:hypothetical protein